MKLCLVCHDELLPNEEDDGVCWDCHMNWQWEREEEEMARDEAEEVE